MIFTAGITHRHAVDQSRQRAIERGLRNKGGARVQQHGQSLVGGIVPQRIEQRVVGHEAGIHRQQLDAAQAELLMPLFQFALPAVLGRIDGQKADQPLRMRCHIVGDIAVVDPQSAAPRFAAEDDCPHIGRAVLAVILVANRKIDFDAGPPARLACDQKSSSKCSGYRQAWLWTSMIMSGFLAVDAQGTHRAVGVEQIGSLAR